MNFADYLLQKQVINEEDYLDLLAQQQRQTPPLVDLLRSQLNWKVEEIIELVRKAQKQKVSLWQILSGHANFESVLEVYLKNKPDFCHILISNKGMAESEVESHLLDYVGSCDAIEEEAQESSPKKDDEEKPAISPAALESLKEQMGAGQVEQDILKELEGHCIGIESSPQKKEEEPPISQAAFESLKEQVENGLMDASVLAEVRVEPEAKQNQQTDDPWRLEALTELDSDLSLKLLDQFNARVIANLSKNIKSLGSDESKREEKLAEIGDHLLSIKEAAKSCRAELLAWIMNLGEQIIGNIKSGPDQGSPSELFEDLYKVFAYGVKVRNSIELEGTEKAYLKEVTTKNELTKIYHNVVQAA